MFDLALQVRLKQARNALQDGRLDEAFTIATDRQVREHRGGQQILEELVKPFLERGSRNLADGRLKEALMDAERAIESGGNRPEALALREKAQQALAEERSVKRRDLELIESARRHVRDGSLWNVKRLLEEASPGSSEAERVQREAETRENRAARAIARAREELDRGEIVEALTSAAEAVASARRHDGLPALLFDLKKAAAARIEESVREGRIPAASDLLARLEPVAGESLEVRALGDVLDVAEKARAAFRASDHATLRIHLRKMRRLVPGAEWVEESLESIEAIEASLTTLRTGPLGCDGAALPARGVPGDLLGAVTMPVNDGRPEAARDAPRSGPRTYDPAMEGQARGGGSKMLLWVDGVGTYLVLTAPRVTLGRTGSSARPDIPLAADIPGIAAEIVRIEDDYFVVGSQGPVRIGGHATDRKLLASGDEIDLGSRCRLRFHLPTALSSTAVLALGKGQRIHGDVRNVVLLKEHLILGPRGKSHVEAGAATRKVVISRESRGMVCRAEEDILVGDRSSGREAVIPPGARVQVGDLTFTLTEWV